MLSFFIYFLFTIHSNNIQCARFGNICNTAYKKPRQRRINCADNYRTRITSLSYVIILSLDARPLFLSCAPMCPEEWGDSLENGTLPAREREREGGGKGGRERESELLGAWSTTEDHIRAKGDFHEEIYSSKDK